MKRFLTLSILASCLFGFALTAHAQNCSALRTWDLRGTYAMQGSGWIDLSKVITAPPPGVPLPSGSIPMNWVGTHILDGHGSGSGWISMNAGGVQLTMDLIEVSYAVKPDCSVETHSMLKIRELGITVGPVARVLVIAGATGQLELFGLLAGAGPGTGGDSMKARRISLATELQQ
jgi:hypothetical protein